MLDTDQQTFVQKNLAGFCEYQITAGSINLFGKQYSKFRFVDWCIWIDYVAANIIYKDIVLTDHDTALFFQGLYFITIALCKKRNYFIHLKDYDNFSLEFSADIYNRYFHKGQYREDNPLPQIRSVKNYIANILYGRKVGYEQREYAQVEYVPGTVGELIELSDPTSINYTSQIKSSLRDLINIDCSEYLSSIKITIYDLLQKTPYKNDKLLINKLETSILLTLIMWQDLAINQNIKINKKNRTKFNAVLYHIDGSFNDYVIVLSRKAMKLILADISELSNMTASRAYLDNESWKYSQLRAVGHCDVGDL